jgi:succinyl-diaminopimelate desuccinylase
MMAVKGAVIDILQAAREDHDSVVEPPRDLVRIPSRGGIDPYGPVLECMAAWLGEHGLACRRQAGAGGATVALTCEVHGGSAAPGMSWMPAWTPLRSATRRHGPTPASGHIAGGWLHGRGSSDSEAGAAIFAHIAARLQDGAGGFGGSVVMLFDVDEHTGGFGGAKAYFEDAGAARETDSLFATWPRSSCSEEDEPQLIRKSGS